MSHIPVPANIGRFIVSREIGHGGMGSVFLARDTTLDRDVAIKLLHQNNPELRERFSREARAAAKLRHRNIITIFDVGDHDGQPFIAMEYIEGQTLSDLIHDGAPVSLDRKLELMGELCEGLAFAHKAGIVHRDIKPANVVVDTQGSLKILDFGIARASESVGMTQVGTLLGTPNYMSPEQVRGQAVDARSDVFAVGAVFYELITHRQAFSAETTAGVLTKILMGRPSPVQDVLPGIDSEIIQIIDRALDREPSGRYQDLQSMAKQIAAVRQRLRTAEPATVAASGWVAGSPIDVGSTVVVPPRPREEAAAAGLNSTPEFEPVDPTPPPHRNRYRTSVIVGTVLLTSAAVIFAVVSSPKPSPVSGQVGDPIAPPVTSVKSSIEGLVVDLGASGLAGAQVVIKRDGREVSRQATDASGSFVAHGLDPGTYSAEVSLGNYKTAQVDNIKLEVGTPSKVNVQLNAAMPPGVARESNTVPAPGVKLDPSPPTSGRAQASPPTSGRAQESPLPTQRRDGTESVPPPTTPAPPSTGAAPGDSTIHPSNPKRGDTWISPADEQTMVWVESGKFEIGGPGGEDDEVPSSEISFDKGFWLDATEVTRTAYRRFLIANPAWQRERVDRNLADDGYLREWTGTDFPPGTGDYPVNNVSWHAAVAYAKWANKRLPSEAEWEYAARDGKKTTYPWGGSFERRYANNGPSLLAVKSTQANSRGIFDLLGNVWEWTSSLAKGYPYDATDGREASNRQGDRVARGGAWSQGEQWLRPANRIKHNPRTTNDQGGFRCAR